MSDRVVHPESRKDAEATLRAQLARADAGAETVLPVLHHLLAAEDNQFFSDEIIARVRNMLTDMVDALLGRDPISEDTPVVVQRLTGALAGDAILLSHLHALAIEWQLAERLQVRLGIDPVYTPLLKTAMASPDHDVQERASAYLAAQARWAVAQRRMQLPLYELPGDVLERVLQALRNCSGERARQVEAEVSASLHASGSRLALAERLAAVLDDDAHSALRVSQTGVSLFLTALALVSRQRRESLVLSIHETQIVRLALALRSAGLDAARTEEQILALHPGAALPAGFENLDRDGATAILMASDFNRAPGV